ncbi:microtubule-destabilizing protein 60-like [Henckelia pumila]|uniref:microtubule-destabilizing protein 60-like n=1 Tax=Henckelia pumila TaxID=405737 RepID=UPI003C6E8C32
MYSSLNSSGAVTRAKETDNLNSSGFNEACFYTENLNPNVSGYVLKVSNSSSIKFGDSTKNSDSRNPDRSTVGSPLVEKTIAKMKSCSKELNSSKETVFCSEYEERGNGNLRAIQEHSFYRDIDSGWEEIERQYVLSQIKGENEDCTEKNRVSSEINLNMCMDRLLEEARKNVPEPGSGRVMHLVKAFEKLLSIRWRDYEGQVQEPQKVSKMQDSSSPFPLEFFVALESLELDSRGSCSLESSQESILTQTSAGSGRSELSVRAIHQNLYSASTRIMSPESAENFSRRHWRRRPRTTSPKPFMLRTEERGKIKEKEFMKKLQQMMVEEEKLRTPTTQGLPWTTEEPECVVKPPTKENTRPIDLVMHSDTRAVQRARFDHQVAKKISLLEHYRMEREKQQKLAEEEEIRRLRRELVPKALPMPYFDTPFVPKRSTKHPTIPREPKFQKPINYKKMKSLKSLDGFCSH